MHHYQTTYFTFTLNNYTESNVKQIKQFAETEYSRLMFGYEIGESGTQHLQSCFQTRNRIRLTTIKNKINIPGIHLECQKKQYLANARYCSKSDNCWFWPSREANFNTDGSPITNTNNKKYLDAVALAKKGLFNQIDPEIYLKYDNKLKKIHVENLKTENMLLNNQFGNFFQDFFILIWGPTGTGKSYCIEDLVYHLQQFWFQYCSQKNIEYSPLLVYNKKCNKWWDSYNGEKIVVIEELELSWVCHSGNLLKQLCDQYPFPVEVKGATINNIRPWWLTQRLTQKKERRTKLLALIDERNFEKLKNSNSSLTVEDTSSIRLIDSPPVSPQFIYTEDFELKTPEYFDNIINNYSQETTTSDENIQVNYCEFHFDFENKIDFDNYILFKKIITGLNQLIDLQNKRINNLNIDNSKLTLKLQF
ncbi:hypothetical protein BCR32DRAFT_251016 [Anaeromyces robustus]|uniref:ATP-dependent helicase Rep n=1 Tax=Anaeromyces robustus TaxID=1754192 RepID=A0A1Y1VUD0_9FUNG|nr:hypothetical protein BCR32DRAFT_251016 [Anaeromyces robustus]|eukprot:ORX64615.1 hypothetical protein BCR32DRAFT_251016 [Anaeromyces robustus]